jgi:hypothetical protein
MEPKEEIGHPGWNLLKSWSIPDKIHTAAIYVYATVSIGQSLMESSAEMGHPGWNLFDLFWLSCSGCLVLAVLFWLSCSGCPVLAVLFWLSCTSCHVLTILFWLSSPFCPPWLSYPSSLLLAAQC